MFRETGTALQLDGYPMEFDGMSSVTRSIIDPYWDDAENSLMVELQFRCEGSDTKPS